ncbi:MAG: helix-turn-helix transcriptional regulator [Polyangia bacterium]
MPAVPVLFSWPAGAGPGRRVIESPTLVQHQINSYRMKSCELCSSCGACYPVPVVRGQPNPLHFGLPLRLKRTRKRADMSSAALAQRAGVSHAIVGYIEANERIPTVETVERLADALGVSAAWLAYGQGEQSSSVLAKGCAAMGQRLNDVRTQRDLTRIELARAANLNPGTIAKIEGGGMAGVDTAEEIAGALHVSPGWLAYGAEPQEAPARRAARTASPG